MNPLVQQMRDRYKNIIPNRNPRSGSDGNVNKIAGARGVTFSNRVHVAEQHNVEGEEDNN